MIESRAKLIDWALSLVVVVLAALVLAPTPVPVGSQGRISAGAVRDFEMGAKLLDAEQALPAEVREAIGITGEPDQDRAQVIEGLRDEVEATPWVHERRLLLSALAAALGDDDVAVAQLDALAEHPEALSSWRVAIHNIHALASGEPAPSWDVLASELRAMGTSEWLVRRLEARHLRNGGDEAGARTALEESRASALAFVDRLLIGALCLGTLWIVGMLLMLLWPLVRRALVGAGHLGLEGTRSPFVVLSTHRVMAAWLLAFIVSGTLLSLAGDAIATGSYGQALSMTAQTLVQGGVAIWLIGRFGRYPDDHAPLTVPLRMTRRTLSGGWLGFALWTLGGTSAVVASVLAAQAFNSAVSRTPGEAQQALELFMTDDGLPTKLILVTAVALFAPIFEEVLFRGFLYRNLRDLVPPPMAMLLSGLLFAFCHLDLSLLLPLTAIGICLAFLYERSGSLLVPIVVHGAWNLGQLVAVYLLMSG